jgi:hypothetical protein
MTFYYRNAVGCLVLPAKYEWVLSQYRDCCTPEDWLGASTVLCSKFNAWHFESKPDGFTTIQCPTGRIVSANQFALRLLLLSRHGAERGLSAKVIY